jgi:hypothetical protein
MSSMNSRSVTYIANLDQTDSSFSWKAAAILNAGASDIYSSLNEITSDTHTIVDQIGF